MFIIIINVYYQSSCALFQINRGITMSVGERVYFWCSVYAVALSSVVTVKHVVILVLNRKQHPQLNEEAEKTAAP